MIEEYDLVPEQAQVLSDLKKLIGKPIPRVKEIDRLTFGVKIENNNVVGLGLHDCGLKSIPRSIGKYLVKRV